MHSENTCVWITGVSGFTGRHLLKHIKQASPTTAIVGFDLHEPKSLQQLDYFSTCPLDDAYQLNTLAEFMSPDYVIHLAGILPPSDGKLMWSVNVHLAMAFATIVAQLPSRVRGFLTIGSAAEYGIRTDSSAWSESEFSQMPASEYGASKLAATYAVLGIGHRLNMSSVVARPFNLIGPNCPASLVLGSVCNQLNARHEEIRTGPLTSIRDFIDIRDAVSAYWMIVTQGLSGEIYNVCSGSGVQIRKGVELAQQLADYPSTLREEGIVEVDYSIGSKTKLEAATGWSPKISLKQSIADMLLDGKS